MRPNFNPFIFQSLLSSGLETAALIFFCLAAQYAARKGGVGLGWIVPMVIGFGLRLFADLCQLLVWAQWQATGTPLARHWYVPISRVIYPLALACFAFGAFRLWQAMRQADDSRPQTSPIVPAAPTEGVWPPPPTRGE